MRLLILSFFAVLFTTAASAESSFRTDDQNLSLSCKPTFATSVDRRDPITNIPVRLTPKSASIVHQARSGLAYNRTDQYVQDSVQWKGSNFAWRGIRVSNPRIAMTGVVEPGPDGNYTYRESQFDAGLGGRKIYDMVSLCVETGLSAAPSGPRVKPPPAPITPTISFYKEKQRMIEIMNERLVACAEPKLSELVRSGEVAAELTDATIAFCRETVDDLISAQMILNNSADKEPLRAAIAKDIRAIAVQVRADARR
jgi:hypothetical protein